MALRINGCLPKQIFARRCEEALKHEYYIFKRYVSLKKAPENVWRAIGCADSFEKFPLQRFGTLYY